MIDALKSGKYKTHAAEISKYRLWMKILASALGAMTIATTTIFMVSMFYTQNGSFTITVNPKEAFDYGLTLSMDREFTKSGSRLDFTQATLGDTTFTSMPKGLDNETGGTKKEGNFAAFTFFMKNSGRDELSYNYALNFGSVTKNIDKAARIMVYHNGESSLYARADSEGKTIEGTEQFYSEGTVVTKTVNGLKPGEIVRFTVVIWLEGNDEDCKDDIIDGVMNLEMRMSVVTTE